MTVMFLVIAVCVLALFAVIGLVRSLSGRKVSLNKLSTQLCSIDVNAFRNLIDEGERDYLRTRLPGREFRKIHRERMLAASEYVRSAARTAGVLIRLGEASINSPDPTVATAAAAMRGNAMRFRLHALETLPRIYVSIVFPRLRLRPEGLPERLDKLNRSAVILECLQVPAQ